MWATYQKLALGQLCVIYANQTSRYLGFACHPLLNISTLLHTQTHWHIWNMSVCIIPGLTHVPQAIIKQVWETADTFSNMEMKYRSDSTLSETWVWRYRLSSHGAMDEPPAEAGAWDRPQPLSGSACSGTDLSGLPSSGPEKKESKVMLTVLEDERL